KGALALLHSSVPGRSRLIAHAVREIRNRLPDRLCGLAEGGTTDYPRLATEITEQWEQAGLSTAVLQGAASPADERHPEASPETRIPLSRARAVAALVDEHHAAAARARQRRERLFEAVSPRANPTPATVGLVVTQWRENTNWFMRCTHDSGRTDGEHNWHEFQ